MRYYSSIAPEMTLVGGITDSAESMQVSSVIGLPTQVPFTLVVDFDQPVEEIVTVTAVAGSTLTITRGQDGTSAVAHSSGAEIRHVATARDFYEPQQHMAATTGVHGLAAGVAPVGVSSTQTLTNKTISGADNTFSNIPQSAVVDLTSDLTALDEGKADTVHTHDAADVTTGVLPIARGGTAGATAEAARAALGAAASSHTHTIANVTGLQTALDGKSATSHIHDDRYYTEAQVDAIVDDLEDAIADVPVPGDAGVAYRTAGGRSSVTISGTTVNKTVSLPAGRFSQPPLVFIEVTTAVAAASTLIHRVTSTSTSSFTVFFNTAGGASVSGAITFDWFAVQMTSANEAG